VKLHLSVHSFFAPFVDLNGRPCPAIKRLIDEEFSPVAMAKTANELEVKDIYQFTRFVNFLKKLIEQIHLDPKAPSHVDIDQGQAGGCGA
jgi:hypothetical protein